MAYACDEIVRLKARPSIAYHGLPPHAAPASAAREHAERAPLFRPTQQHLACLASNAAVKLRLKGFLGTSDEDFEWALRMNFFAALRATRAAITEMVKRGGGAGGTVDYGAAKAALVNVTKALSQEFGPSGIRINDVSPGPVATDLWLGKDGVAETVAKATGVDPETARNNVVASIGGLATGRFTTPEEVATLVVMLASKRTANVTGANYVIDGGLIKTT